VSKHDWILKYNSKRPNRGFIWNETYSQGVYVLWPVTTDRLKVEYTHVNKHHSFSDTSFRIIGNGARFLSCDGVHCIGFAQKRPGVGFIAHESMHLVNFIFSRIGIKPSKASEEAYCYFHQWLVDKIYNLTRGIK